MVDPFSSADMPANVLIHQMSQNDQLCHQLLHSSLHSNMNLQQITDRVDSDCNSGQEGLAVASIAQDVVVAMTPPRDDNAR